LGGGTAGLTAVIDDQLERRRARRTPSVDEDAGWTVVLKGDQPSLRRVHQTLLTVADTRFGTRGVREEEGPGQQPTVLAGGVFDEAVVPPTLLEGPIWTGLQFVAPVDASRDRRMLDLRTGVLLREQPADPVPMRSIRFSSLARPGTVAMRAEGGVDSLHPGAALTAPASEGTFVGSQHGGKLLAHRKNERGGVICAAAAQREHYGAGRRTVERIASYLGDAGGGLHTGEVGAALAEAADVGFDALLAEHRAAWAGRWRDAEVELAVRFNLFHLMASVPTDGEAAVGPRGLSGPAYGGHVFWDADVFVLPFLAATCPPAARAMLEYRIRRLGPARQRAADRGYAGCASRGSRPVTAPTSRPAACGRRAGRWCPSVPGNTKSMSRPMSPGRRYSTPPGPATRGFWPGRAGRWCSTARRPGPSGHRPRRAEAPGAVRPHAGGRHR
jgi:Glycosyl hydrolase family 65 central catalytic domain